MDKVADVVVIGGGIVGTAILAALCHYDLKAILVEKEPDIALGSTKANSGIIHAGYDALPGIMKARMNVRGNELYHEIEKELNLDIKWTGSLVVALNEVEDAKIEELYARGLKNNVPSLEIWSGYQVRKLEPNLSKDIVSALWAPTAGICWPFGIAQAFGENAILNGGEIWRECAVTGFVKEANAITGVQTPKGVILTKYVINAAGIAADEISQMAGDCSFTITPRKGEYLLFDKTASDVMTKRVIFPTPNEVSKGILLAATTHGNVFIGPNAQDLDIRLGKTDTAVTTQGMNYIISEAKKILPNIPLRSVITEFAGLRAVASTNDFILGKSPMVSGLIQAAGIQSPGLSSAPAIAEYVSNIVVAETGAQLKENYVKGRPAHKVFAELERKEQQNLVEENSLYGRVICRCETITEAEIMDAIHRPCGARTIDGVKRRTRAGMGRCQGGFCAPRVTKILARELHIPITQVRKELGNSYMFYDKKIGSIGEQKADDKQAGDKDHE